MQILDVRRLTGPNLDLDGAGAVAEVDFGAAVAREAGLACCEAALERVLPGVPRVIRQWPGGGAATLALPGEIDRLYALVNLVEGLLGAIAEVEDGPPEARLAELRVRYEAEAAAEIDPGLVPLRDAAAAHGVPFLWDDDAISLGHGPTAEVFAPRALPAPEELDWTAYGDIPRVLITGTNGKTTTGRMVARILKHHGFIVGATSTDALSVDEVIVDRGDWTGPGAARRILRDRRVTAAVLETARGGILRRGLGVTAVDAALVTNVGADHLGDHGIVDVAGMAKVKAAVWRAVRPGGRCIVNAACDESFSAAQSVGGGAALDPARWVLVAADPRNPRLGAHRERGGEVWYVAGGAIWRGLQDRDEKVVAVSAIPAAWGGAAAHNVANAMAAGALAAALGVPLETIAAALKTFGASVDDNPGRAERWRVGEVQVLLDFGHNPHGLAALAPMVRAAVGGGRLLVSVGQAGDRSEEDLRGLVAGCMALGPARVIVRTLPGYARGRAEGEVEALLMAAFQGAGVPEGALSLSPGEVDALEAGLAWATPGDTVLHLVHVEREAVRERLAALGARAG